jgi:hypothetical protein
MSTDNLRKLEKSLSGFCSTFPWNIYCSVWRSTIPLYVPDSQANVSDCKHGKQFCCYQGFISTPRLHQMRCSVSHYCTITLTVKSRDDAAQSLMQQNLNKRRKTEYRQANEPRIQNEQKKWSSVTYCTDRNWHQTQFFSIYTNGIPRSWSFYCWVLCQAFCYILNSGMAA